jgi:hypothetical protein
MALLTLRKSEEQGDIMTDMIREIAIDNSSREILDGEIIFLVRAYNE